MTLPDTPLAVSPAPTITLRPALRSIAVPEPLAVSAALTRTSLPALRIRAPPIVEVNAAPMITSCPACNVRDLPPVFALASMAARTLMSLFACKVTFAMPSCVTTAPVVMMLVFRGSVAKNMFGVLRSSNVASPCRSGADPWIVMFSGSSSSVPVLPPGARKSTFPPNTRLFLPETSVKPPSPFCGPPRASMPPWNLVTSSAHTITLPPFPSAMASALMFESALT